MSYQCIFSGPLLPGQSRVAERRILCNSIPQALEQELSAIGRPHPGSRPTQQGEPSFNYRQVICAATSFHILSCTHYHTADNGYTTRLLALTEDEVQALRRNASRPTPAGVIVALGKIGVWDADNEDVETEPRLTAAALPDASVQPTWKQLSGHKGNAKAFFVYPYDRECIITVPRGTSTEDILKLCHESDWLTSSRGWGKTFTTHGSEQDTHQEFTRIFTTPGSKIEKDAIARAATILTINDELVITQENDTVPVSAPLGVNTHHQPIVFAPPPTHTSAPAIPYKYTETPDEDVFNILPKPKKWVRLAFVLGGLGVIWCASSLVSGIFIDDAGEITGQIITKINEQEDIQLLSELASAPYSPNSTARKLDQLESHLRALPPTEKPIRKRELLRECVQLLRCASTDAHGHPSNMSRLIECAEALDISPDGLCRLYLNEAIHDRPLEEWQSNTSNTEFQGWMHLLSQWSYIKPLLQEEKFYPYMADVLDKNSVTTTDIGEEPVTPTPAVVTPEPEPEPKVDATPEPTQQTPEQDITDALVPELVTVGRQLPAGLRKLFSGEEVKLTNCEYEAIAIGSNTSALIPPTVVKHGQKLSITPGDNANTWLIRAEGTAAPVRMTLTQDGILTALSSNGVPTAVKLRHIDNSRRQTYLLIPSLEIPVVGILSEAPDKATPSQLTITPDRLTLGKPEPNAPAGKLDLQKHKDFSNLNTEVPVTLNPPLHIVLPNFTGKNQIIALQPDAKQAIPYSWNHKRITTDSDSINSWACSINRRYSFAAPVLQTFLQVANSSCCGEVPNGDPRYSIAALYSVADEKHKGKTRKEFNAVVDRFYSLHTDKRFVSRLPLILGTDLGLELTDDEINKRGATHNQARNRITRTLKESNIRRIMRLRICELLTRSVTRAYEAAYAKQTVDSAVNLQLKLERVSLGPDGELTWYFILQTPTP